MDSPVARVTSITPQSRHKLFAVTLLCHIVALWAHRAIHVAVTLVCQKNIKFDSSCERGSLVPNTGSVSPGPKFIVLEFSLRDQKST